MIQAAVFATRSTTIDWASLSCDVWPYSANMGMTKKSMVGKRNMSEKLFIHVRKTMLLISKIKIIDLIVSALQQQQKLKRFVVVVFLTLWV